MTTSSKARRHTTTDPVIDAAERWAEQGWSEAAAGFSAVSSVIQVQRLMLARAEQILLPFGLTYPRYEVLSRIMMSPELALTSGELSRMLQLHPASVSSLVHRLVRDRMVKLRQGSDDKRVFLVELTRSGQGRAMLAARELNDSFYTKLGVGERALSSTVKALLPFRHLDGDFSQPSWGTP